VVGLTVLLLSAECRQCGVRRCKAGSQSVDMAGRGGPMGGNQRQGKSGEVRRSQTQDEWRLERQRPGCHGEAFRPLFPLSEFLATGDGGWGTGVFWYSALRRYRIDD
jgi:hypothetical protein